MEQHSQQSLIFCKLQIYMQRIDSLLPQYDTLFCKELLTVLDLRVYIMHVVKHESLLSINTKHIPFLAHP
jgi:hypothetical protein